MILAASPGNPVESAYRRESRRNSFLRSEPDCASLNAKASMPIWAGIEWSHWYTTNRVLGTECIGGAPLTPRSSNCVFAGI